MRVCMLRRVGWIVALWIMMALQTVRGQDVLFEVKPLGDVSPPVVDRARNVSGITQKSPLYAIHAGNGMWDILHADHHLQFDLSHHSWHLYDSPRLVPAVIDPVEYLSYHPTLDRHLLVVSGGGKVYQWQPGDTVIVEHNSIPLTRDQYSAAKTTAENGDIYYYGGVGLWLFKDKLTKLDVIADTMMLIGGVNDNPPGARLAAFLFHDASHNKVILIGGARREIYVRQCCTESVSFDVWEGDLSESPMTWRKVMDPSVVGRALDDFSTVPSEDGMHLSVALAEDLYLIPLDRTPGRQGSFLLYDVSAKAVARVSGIVTERDFVAAALAVSPNRDSLYVLSRKQSVRGESVTEYRVSVAPIPSADQLRSYVAKHRLNMSVINVMVGWIFLFGGITLGIWLMVRGTTRGRRNEGYDQHHEDALSPTAQHAARVSSSRSLLQVAQREDGGISVQSALPGRPWVANLSREAFHLLEMLAEALIDERGWVSAAQLEDSLQISTGSAAYRRKRRNAAIKQIKQVSRGLPNGRDLLQVTSGLTDRRTVHYRLNPQLVQWQRGTSEA